MEMGYPAEKKIALFMECRYDILNKLYPHETFSAEQAHLSFFQDTLDYLLGKVEIPKKEKGNEYKNNYIDWLEEWKKQLE